MFDALESVHRCGIVFAAGQENHRQALIRRSRGDGDAEQRINLVGARFVLAQTVDRAERLIPPDQLFIVVSRHDLTHQQLRYELAQRPKGTVVVERRGRGSAASLLLTLMHVYRRYPGSNVAVFPLDRYLVEENLLLGYVAVAFCAVEKDPSRIVLLGFMPDRPNPGYGYIVPGEKVRDLATLGLHGVKLFIENPKSSSARELVMSGGLWNSLLMVFHSRTLLNLVRDVAPAVYQKLDQIQDAIGTRDESYATRELYRHMEEVDFSVGVLEHLAAKHPASVAVLPVRGVDWSVSGSEIAW